MQEKRPRRKGRQQTSNEATGVHPDTSGWEVTAPVPGTSTPAASAAAHADAPPPRQPTVPAPARPTAAGNTAADTGRPTPGPGAAESAGRTTEGLPGAPEPGHPDAGAAPGARTGSPGLPAEAPGTLAADSARPGAPAPGTGAVPGTADPAVRTGAAPGAGATAGTAIAPGQGTTSRAGTTSGTASTPATRTVPGPDRPVADESGADTAPAAETPATEPEAATSGRETPDGDPAVSGEAAGTLPPAADGGGTAAASAGGVAEGTAGAAVSGDTTRDSPRTFAAGAAPAVAPAARGARDGVPVGKGRRTRVRRRLTTAVAVVALAVAGAAAPGLLGASTNLNDSQSLVTLAERTQQALTLAYALADERDEVTAYVAAGRPHGKSLSKDHSARVDRQVAELRAEAPADLGHDLDQVAAVRENALTGKGGALAAHQAYAHVILELHRLAEDLADRIPPRAGSGAHALADLDNAVEQAAATRGLLLAALAVPGTATTVIDPVTGLPRTVTDTSDTDRKQRDELTAAAQQARVREQAAFADFHDQAPAAYRASYDSTVNGAEVTTAEKRLDDLTAQPTLDDDQLDTDAEKLGTQLTARIDLMRGAEASLSDQRTKELAGLRDDDVTALELRAALAGVCLLLAVGVIMGTARSLTRPLAVLRRGTARIAADPVAEEPIRFTGRNDEFAEAVRSVNALHERTVALHEQLTASAGDRARTTRPRPAADESTELRAALAAATTQLDRLKDSIQGTYVNLALRTLGLVERQLGVIERLEDQEQDPDRLATLFKLDHFATVMRRHSENLLVLAGADHGHQHPGPVPLVDVVRAAVSEIERYERVRISSLPPHAHVPGFAADDLSHLLAELMENATSFSPPDAQVEASGWLMENGEVMLSVVDEGIGMTKDRLADLNSLLDAFDPDDPAQEPGGDGGLGLGLYVVARLAHRHGVRVRLRQPKQGGVAAVVVLPESLLPDAPVGQVTPERGVPVAGGAPVLHQPGSEAEANSNTLPVRSARPAPGADQDPLIAAAEASMATARADAVHDTAPAPASPQPNPYAIGPDAHERVRDDAEAAPARAAAQPPHTAPDPAEAAPPPDTPVPSPDDADGRGTTWERLTDKGLPKRTPRLSASSAVPAARTDAVDAEALRQRLGGFQQGSRDGRRDAETEVAGVHQAASGQGATAREGDQHGDDRGKGAAAPTARVEGETVEEARS